MYIGSIMRTDLITVAPKTTLVEAKELFGETPHRPSASLDRKSVV